MRRVIEWLEDDRAVIPAKVWALLGLLMLAALLEVP